MPRAGRNWVPLDTGYFDDRRVIELSVWAQILDLRGICMAKRLQTDGCLSPAQLRSIAPSSDTDSDTDESDLISELIEAELWEQAPDGSYIRRSWKEWNTSADEIAAKSAGGRLGNHRKHHVKTGNPNHDCELCHEEGLV